MFPELSNKPTEPEEQYYWRLTTKDGRQVLIPPSAVSVVRRRIEARETINTTSITVPFSEIKTFEKTAKKAINIPLIEDAAKAFGEPMITEFEDGTLGIKARWVKKEVTASEYAAYYAKHLSYQKIGDTEEGHVMVAFVMAAHAVDTDRVEYCTTEEIQKLDKYN